MDINEYYHILFTCRRGMLELDIIFRKFIEKMLPVLTDYDKLMFIKLLEHDDRDLFDWIVKNNGEPTNQCLKNMVKTIKNYLTTVDN